MEAIEVKEILEKEFGLVRNGPSWFFSGLVIENHKLDDLQAAFEHLLCYRSLHEFSKVCISSSIDVSLILNCSPPLCIVLTRCDEDLLYEFLGILLESPQWQETTIFNGPYVFEFTPQWSLN